MAADSKLLKHTFGQSNPFTPVGFSYLPNLPFPTAGSYFPGAAPQIPAPFDYAPAQSVLYAPDNGNAARPSGAGNGGGGGKGGGGGTSGPTPSGSSSLVINISWDSSVQSAPSGFTSAVMTAAQYLESQFTDPVTLNLSIGYGEVNGTALGSNALGASESYLNSYSYSSLRSALTADASSAVDQSAAASLPASSPVNGQFWTTTAQAKALGLAAATGTSTDGYIGFSSALPFTYNDSSGVASGTYDFNGVALHEMTEVMGRMLFTGGTVAGYANSYTLLDLMHYSAAGARDFSASTPGYFSVDNGQTNLGNFNTVSGGDAGDWSSTMGYNSFDAFSYSGVVNPVTTNDLREIDAIGWNRAGIVTASPITSALNAAQGASGLSASTPLALIAQTGMPSGDTYTYALGGAGAGSFNLTTTSNGATLTTGANGAAGGAGGQLYSLTVTPTDTSSGTTGPASPLDVIVGSGGGGTINIASLTGALGTATPTFVYGLAGNDTLNGANMTGNLWLAGGAGADTMTGGSGVNEYLYGAVSDSTASATDLITNFQTAKDLINLAGLGVSLTYAGKIHGSSLAADTIGWQSAKGSTSVYVNTSSGSESLSATDMKIAMNGSLSLTSHNFVLA